MPSLGPRLLGRLTADLVMRSPQFLNAIRRAVGEYGMRRVPSLSSRRLGAGRASTRCGVPARARRGISGEFRRPAAAGSTSWTCEEIRLGP